MFGNLNITLILELKEGRLRKFKQLALSYLAKWHSFPHILTIEGLQWFPFSTNIQLTGDLIQSHGFKRHLYAGDSEF